jgi:hypothetical protein
MRRHDQLGHVVTDRLVRAVAEGRLGRVVPVEDAPSVIHHDDGVEGGLEHGAQPRLARPHLGLGVTPHDELAHLAADHAHRLEQLRIGFAELAREELHHADYTPGAEEREAERRLEPGAARGVSAREIAIVRRVEDPARPARDDQPARKAFAGGEGEPLAEGLELRSAVARMPRGDAAKAAVVRPELPHGAELPAERPADHLERRLVGLDRRLCLREDLSDVVLDALQGLRVNDDFHGQG